MSVSMSEFEIYREKIAFILRLTAFPNYDPDTQPLHFWYQAAQNIIEALTIDDLETIASYKRTIAKYSNIDK